MSCTSIVSYSLYVLILAGWDEGVAKVSECLYFAVMWGGGLDLSRSLPPTLDLSLSSRLFQNSVVLVFHSKSA